MSNIHFLSYLRKGLGQYIDKNSQPSNNSRATINLKVIMEGKPVGDSNQSPEEFERQLSLVGPADVKQVNPGIISQIYPPAINTERFNSNFMPYMEFFEADFPWRYTPLPAKGVNCTPWLVLVAVTEDEYKLETKEGKKKVMFNLTDDHRYNEVFPEETIHDKLAHVQLEKDGDEEGISRLLCGSKLPAGERITVFLLPAFEIGRLSGLGMNYDNTNIGKLSWADKAKEFPVYYHWSFNTSEREVTFETLAKKLDMKPASAYNDLKANLTVDFAESGLADDGLDVYRDRKEECVIDVPAALNLALGNKKDLRDEAQYSTTYRKSLKEELSLNPVFVENIKGEPPTDEDPWVVPPVYGARHLLSENLDGNDVVAEVNLKLKHRIAAGMGASVVKENQESFVHRAWQKVEKINQLNQELREYYQMQEVEQKAENRLANETASIQQLWNTQLSRRRIRLIGSDALPRTLHNSKLNRKRISTQNVRSVASDNWKPADDGKRIIGITPEELQDLFNYQTWESLMNSDEFDEFKELIANHIIEQYKQEHNWMQYFFMPYYDKATDPENWKLCGIGPKRYIPGGDFFLISPEITELYRYSQGWFSDFDNFHHTINFYRDAVKEALKQKSIFDPTRYSPNHPQNSIYEMVYPVPVDVYIKSTSAGTARPGPDSSPSRYNGYIMDATLYKNNGFGNHPFTIFEYQQTKGATVTNKKGYVFLFSSDFDGLNYSKHIYLYSLQKYLNSKFYYRNGEYVPVEDDFNDFDKHPISESPLLKLLQLDNIGKKLKIDSKHHNLVYIEEMKGAKVYIQADGSMGITMENGKVVVDENSFKSSIEQFYRDLYSLESSHYVGTPNQATVYFGNSIDEFDQRSFSMEYLQKTYDNIIDCYKQLKDGLKTNSSKFGLKQITPIKEEEPEPDTPNLEEEKQDTIKAIVEKYGYTEEAQLDEIKQRGLTKYPVMIYPDFLDPTFFYLRELSQNYIVPSAGELTNNSVTIFNNNPAFEEAFLMGMNTEMGQELLWREYPTDQRGSYFRKFWVAAELPEKKNLETQYFDIKKIHNWKQPLGKNHVKQNAQMLVFAIKGELMQAYPKTTIYLSQYDETKKTITVVKRASMRSWLSEDTYLVGFEDINMQQETNLCLTFQEDVTGLEFEYNENKANSSPNSAVLAKDLINTQSVFLLPINN